MNEQETPGQNDPEAPLSVPEGEQGAEPEQPPAEPEGRLTVDQWATKMFPPTERGMPHRDAWKHGAAEALHGWKLHSHHANEPMRLSREDYLEAIEAASAAQEDGSYQPHGPALSQYLGAR
jgi:hypothetical protein